MKVKRVKEKVQLRTKSANKRESKRVKLGVEKREVKRRAVEEE